MAQTVFVALGAGAATALLFASLTSGSLLSILLFCLAPLPILIAALGWNHWTGLCAAFLAAAALALALGSYVFVPFLVGTGLPAWWLGYLALLARPAERPTPDGLDWYPVGRLVIWAALLGTLVVAAAIPNFGVDEASFRTTLKSAFERILRAQFRTPADAPLQIPGVSDVGRFLDLLVLAMPATAAVLATVTNMINLWLAGRIVKLSGRLRRPWPDIAAMQFPPLAPVLLAGAILLSFLPGLVGIIAGLLATCLLVAYAVLGFAVLHTITRDIGARAVVLGGAYAAVLVLVWPVLLMALLGLADAALDLRGRVARKRGPPTIRT
jgi:hypothetical protein